MRTINFIFILFAVMLVGFTGNNLYSQDDNIPEPRCVCAECEVECGKGHKSTCSSSNKSLMDDPLITNKELEGKWLFKTIGGNEVVKEKAGKEFPYIKFNTADGSISGNTGCNVFNGNVTESTGVMSFSSMTTTKMFCSDALYEMDITSVFFSKDQYKYKIESGVLIISKEDKEIMTLVKAG